MAQLLAIHLTDAALLGCLLRRLGPDVSLGPLGEASAAGVGFFQSDDVLLRKRPLAGRQPIPERLAEGVASEGVLLASGGVVQGARATFTEETTFPFRFKRWLFALAGAPDALAPARQKLLEGVPEYLRRASRGDSAAESLFFAFLSRLREAGRLDDVDVDADTTARALASAVGAAERACEQLSLPMAGLCAVVTNGRVLAAARRGHPLWLKLHEGLFGCAKCELPAGASDLDPRVRAHRVLKAVIVSSAAAGAEGFREVGEGELLAVSRGLAVKTLR